VSDDRRLKEYEIMREEILHSDRLVVQVISISLGLIGVVLGQGIVAQNPFVFLVPFPFIWAISRYVEDKRWLIWLVAAYLRKHIEGPKGPSWETWVFAFRSNVKKKGGRFCPAQNVMMVECLLFNVISLSCVGLYVAFGIEKGVPGWSYCVPAILCLFVGWSTVSGCLNLTRQGRAGSRLAQSLPTPDEFSAAVEEVSALPAVDLYRHTSKAERPNNTIDHDEE
jgi:hypothetical protein